MEIVRINGGSLRELVPEPMQIAPQSHAPRHQKRSVERFKPLVQRLRWTRPMRESGRLRGRTSRLDRKAKAAGLNEVTASRSRLSSQAGQSQEAECIRQADVAEGDWRSISLTWAGFSTIMWACFATGKPTEMMSPRAIASRHARSAWATLVRI